MLYSIGIDPSLTATGIVIVNSSCETVKQHLIHTEADCYICPQQRLQDIMTDLITIIKDYNIGIVNIEGLSYNSTSTSFQERCGLYFMITTYFFNKDINFIITPPRSLKKLIAGNGNASKEQMIEVVQGKYNQNMNNDDNLCDAYGLARVGWETIYGRQK